MVVVDCQTTARTHRLYLRPLALKDAPDVQLMHSHAETMKHTSMLPSDDLERAKAWIQGCHDRPENWNFAIELLPTAEGKRQPGPLVIGMMGAVRAPEIGYMFNFDYWGQGYATEALRAFLPLFFDYYSGGEQPRYEFAEAFVDPSLVSSQKVLEKVGFKLHERREKDFESPTLGLRDTLIYRVYRSSSNDKPFMSSN